MPPVIQAQRLTKMYGSRRGIEELDLSIESGEIFGYLGPNGSGKTTTIRLMLNFIRPSRGRLLVFGQTPGGGGRALRHRIGYLPGELGLYEFQTGDQALRLYQGLSGGSAPLRDWLCEMLQLKPEDRSRRIKHYSKGMKQKIGIIQAMQHDPDLIILDEPTGGLDPLVQSGFYDVLRELKSRGRTIFFSSHVLSEVQRVCDHVAVLREGRLVLHSTVSEMAATADRLLYIKIPPTWTTPTINSAKFLRREGDWIIYHTPPSSVAAVLEDLAQLRPPDFRFESALEESFLKLYGVHCAS